MSNFTTKELVDAVKGRLEAATFQGTATTIFKLVVAPAVFDIQAGFRYAANLPAAMVLFDGQDPHPDNPEWVTTKLGIVCLTSGPATQGVDQFDEGNLIASGGLLDIVTGVRQSMGYHDGDDDAFQAKWMQTTSGFILARRDSPSLLIGVELKFECEHQDLTT